ncbi:hypothetical protein RTBOTA2_006880 [Rhodotorula toruloides]|nr:hypothetical protein RTBOTA2_006880 [Rhodotorula toruloides]
MASAPPPPVNSSTSPPSPAPQLALVCYAERKILVELPSLDYTSFVDEARRVHKINDDPSRLVVERTLPDLGWVKVDRYAWDRHVRVFQDGDVPTYRIKWGGLKPYREREGAQNLI